ncbi:MAG: beta-propeller fold lactonase family protein, partial [Oscillochloris sp.]|nr:beta-propeller fold lactonase family protein [Oscillochloris sp.]
GVVGFCATEPVAARHIHEPSRQMHNRGNGKGGGIATLNSQTGFDIRPKSTLLNVTLALNASDNNQGGGLYSQAPSSSYPEVTVLGNTIISSSDDVGGNCVGGAYTSRGHNLDSGSSCGLSGTGDLNNADARLGAPFFNGGPIPTLLTMKLKPGSAAIDTGDNAICDAEPVDSEDQRGSARPQDGNGIPPSTCDIGSYEGDPVVAGFGSDPVAPGPIPFGNATVGTSLPGNLSIFNTGDATLTISAGSLTGTNAADFALTTSFPISIAPGDPAKTIGLTCTPSASGSRSASLILSSNAPGATSVSYTLDCTGTPVPTAGFGSTPTTPGPIDVGKVRVGESKSASLQIAEIGSTALNVSAMSIGGLNPGDFSLDSTANISIANGGSAVSRTITCTPSTIGQRSATLIMQTNDPNQTSVSFALSCTGKPAPQKIFEETGTTVATTSGPYGVTLDPQGAQVYMTTDGAGAIDRYLRDDNGYPTSGVNYVDGALGGSNLAGSRMSLVSPDGKFVYTTAMIDDAINVFTRNLADGTLTYQESVKFGDTYGVLCLPAPCSLPTVKGLNGAYVMALSPDGQYMYVSGISSNSITILSRNPDTGSLKHQILGFTRPSVVQEYQDNTNLSGAYGIAISPDGKHLYATGYSSDTLVVFTRKTDGSLDTTPAKITVYKASDSGLGGLNGVFRVTVSPDGRFVYSASYDGDSVMAFQRDPASGKLTLAGTYTNGQNGLTSLDGVSSVVVNPDSRYLIVSAAFSKAVSIFARDQDTGELDQLQVISSANIEGTRDVAVAPDGRMIFVSGYLSNKVVGFALANPVPAITSLEPASASTGSAQITLSIHGEGFAPGAIVTWGGTDLIGTQFVSSSEVTVPVPVSLLSSAGTAQVGVRNPAPGGGSSTNNVAFTIVAPNQNSVPSITTIIPGGVLAGSSSQVVSVNGAGFLANSAILWNGIERPTVYIDGSTLQATISANDMLQPGTSSVAVRNPAPGGGVSNIVSFNVAAPGENPVPAISAIMPKSTIAGSVSTEQVVTISGANFTAESQAYWAGNARPTTYVSPTELRVAISGGDLLSVGAYSISVSNPEPGGGTSNNAIFRIGAAGSNPVPSVRTSNLVFTTGGGLQITLSGEGFVSGAKVRFGGVEYTPSSVSATQIVFSIPKSAARSASLFVVNPVPGGGKSDALLVSVWQMRIPLVRR